MNTELLIIVGAISFFFLVLNVIFLGIIFFMRRRMAAVSQWPSTLGTVHASFLERRSSSEGGYTNYPVVQYSYQVSDKPIREGRLLPDLRWAIQARERSLRAILQARRRWSFIVRRSHPMLCSRQRRRHSGSCG